MSDKNFDPGMEDTCELKEAWADGKKLYYVEDIPGLLERIASLNKQLEKANERVAALEKRNINQSKTIEAMEGCIANEIAKAFEKALIPRRAKAGCIGEFNFIIEDAICCPQCWEEKSDDCDMCNGKSGETGLSDLTATVPWDLCKEIWLRMNKIYAEQLREEQEYG